MDLKTPRGSALPLEPPPRECVWVSGTPACPSFQAPVSGRAVGIYWEPLLALTGY